MTGNEQAASEIGGNSSSRTCRGKRWRAVGDSRWDLGRGQLGFQVVIAGRCCERES